MEIRGVKLKKQSRYSKDGGLFVLKEPDYFSVPLLADDGDKPIRAVNIGDMVKEGTMIAKPFGRYGSFVYSPCSGKVVGVSKKLNASGNECEHVIIARDYEEEKEFLTPLTTDEYNLENLIRRLYESGIVDNFKPFDPAYKKYLLRSKSKTLVINCTEDEPYKTCDTALMDNYYSEIIEGAKLLKTVARADSIVFIFTNRQKKIAKKVIKHIKQLQQNKLIRVKLYPNMYPLNDSRLLAFYETGKMVPEGGRTAQANVIVDSPNNCYDFFMAVTKGIPCVQRVVSVVGNNCLRKANYFIKNGTSIDHILSVVGTKEEHDENMLIYGGVMSGIAQETLDISATLTASCLLFINRDEYVKEAETVCINCGKCVECCPVRMHVKNIDDAILIRDYKRAKKLGIEACIGCGVCSYVCPAKRFLAQRISYAKDIVLGKNVKSPDSSEYAFNRNETIKNQNVESIEENFIVPTGSNNDEPAIDEMIEIMKSQKEMVSVKDVTNNTDTNGGNGNE